MVRSAFVLVVSAVFLSATAMAAVPATEETLRVMLAKLRQNHVAQMRQSIFGGAEDLRDAVSASKGSAKEKLANRLPGMAMDPFNVCRDLRSCREAPQSMHVEDNALIDDAFVALARPWFKLQKARGKTVLLTVDPGIGVRLDLQDMPNQPFVALTATPTETGGFDVSLEEGPKAALAFAAERALVLKN